MGEPEYQPRASIPQNRAAFGIGRSGDTSPRLGCCKVAGGYCGGNLFRVRRLTAQWTGQGYCGSNALLPVGEPLESTRRDVEPASRRARARSLRSAVRKGSPLRSDRSRGAQRTRGLD